MKVFFPLLTLLAVVVFGASAMVAAVLSFVLPAILLGLMLATIARPFLAVRLGAAGFKALGGAFSRTSMSGSPGSGCPPSTCANG